MMKVLLVMIGWGIFTDALLAGGVAAVDPVSHRGHCRGGVFATIKGDFVSAGTGAGLPAVRH